MPQLAAAEVPADVQGQVGVTSNWFFLNSRVRAESIELESNSLIQADGMSAHILWRALGEAV